MSDQSKRQPWLTGMPGYQLSFPDRSIPSVLLGGIQAAREVLFALDDAAAFQQRFEEEYLAVTEALLDAGMPFRVLNLHAPETPLARRLQDAGYPNFRMDVEPRGSSFLYPRDLLVYLPRHNVALVDSHWLRPGAGDRGGVACWPSAWCEGGRVLLSGDTLVVFRHPDKPGAPEQETLSKIRDRGLRVIEIPAGVFASLDGDGHITTLFHDHHIDRTAGLVRDRSGRLHLLLDPGYRTGPLDAPWTIEKSRDAVRQVTEAASISLHIFPQTGVPYATSLLQARDGVVVSGCAEEAGLALLRGIAGAGNVVATSISLTHFATFASAGLHCIVTESPEFLLAGQ